MNQISIKFTKGLLITLVMSLFVSSTQAAVKPAATNYNYAEMSTALFAGLTGVAAVHHDMQNNKKVAALLHLTTDTISILNKAFFVYNNVFSLNADAIGLRKDLMVNGALGLRDMTKWGGHLKQYLTIFGTNQANVTQAMDVDLDSPDNEAINQDVDQIDKLAYACQVILPSLNGLTAFAVACTQNGATQYASKRARDLATAAHSFVKMLTEYNSLKPGSTARKVIAGVLLVNAAWFIYEVKQYLDQATGSDKPSEDEQKKGECSICLSEDVVLIKLGCNKQHSYCEKCIAAHIRTGIANNKTPSIHCLGHRRDAKDAAGCTHIIDVKDIQKIKTVSLNEKGSAADNEKFFKERALADWQTGARGFKACKTPGCNGGYILDSDADSFKYTCPGCKQSYCSYCQGNHREALCPEPAAEKLALRDARRAAAIAGAATHRHAPQYCPECAMLVYRREACPHITCECKYQFCYHCTREWRTHFGANSCGNNTYDLRWPCRGCKELIDPLDISLEERNTARCTFQGCGMRGQVQQRPR